MGEDRSTPVDYLLLSSDRADNGIDMVRSVTDGRYIYSRNYLPFMPPVRYINYFEIGKIQQLMRKDYAQGELNELQQSLFELRPAEYLYDINNDLWETNNLVNNPKVQHKLKQMRNQLESDVSQSRDVMFLPEYEIGKISEHTTPYEYRMDSTKYPIEKIYKTASLSGRRGVDIAKQQIVDLSSTNKIIRYWAILGLRSQPPAVLKSYRKKILAAIEDPYPPVSITASAIAYQEFVSKEAEANIKQYLRGRNTDLVLMAVNYLLYLDNRTSFIGEVKKIKQSNGMPYRIKAACNDFLRTTVKSTSK